jgi:hypothetical protein
VSDDDQWPAEVFLGIGATHTLSERVVKKSRQEPIGFVHFPDQPEVKARRLAKPNAKLKSKRRKRCG